MRAQDKDAFFKRLQEADTYLIIMFNGNHSHIELGPTAPYEKVTPFAREVIRGIMHIIDSYIMLHNILSNLKKHTKKENAQ